MLRMKNNFIFKFGCIWTAFSMIFTIVVFLASRHEIFPLIFCLVFDGIGIFMLVKGIKQYKKDKNTEKHGDIKYAIVLDVFPNGSYVNNRPQYSGKFGILDDDDIHETYEEIIGFNPDIDIGEFVKVKCYNDDINIVEKVLESALPFEAKNCNNFIDFSKEVLQTKEANGSIEYLSDDEIVINGERYKKAD